MANDELKQHQMVTYNIMSVLHVDIHPALLEN